MLKKIFGILAVVGFLAGTGVACYFLFSQDQNGQNDQNPQSTLDQGTGRILPVTSYTTSDPTELKLLSKEEKDRIVEIVITGPTDDFGEDYVYGDDYEYEETEWVLEKDTFEGFINLKTVKIENTECNETEAGTFDNLNIEELIFIQNYFEEVDHAIKNITTLQRLTLDYNPLTSYPESLEFVVNYPNLKYLALNEMEINKFPRFPVSLEHLVMKDLSKNPPDLTYLKNLQTVDYSDMSSIHASLNKHNLPQSVKNLILQNTGFDNNKTNFSTAFLGLKNLETLDLSNSRDLKEIDTEFPNSKSLKNLRMLDLSRSPIEKLSKKTFRHLKNLEVIGLHGTKLKYIDPSWFKHNKNLQTLRISGNPFNCNEKFLKALEGFKKEKYVLEDAMTEYPRFIPEGEYKTFFCTNQKVVHHGHHHHHHHHDHSEHEEHENHEEIDHDHSEENNHSEHHHDHSEHEDHESEDHDHNDHKEESNAKADHHEHKEHDESDHSHHEHNEEHEHSNLESKEEHDHKEHSNHNHHGKHHHDSHADQENVEKDDHSEHHEHNSEHEVDHDESHDDHTDHDHDN